MSDLVKNFVSGGVGGVAAIISGHPFDTVKVRLQTMPLPLAGMSLVTLISVIQLHKNTFLSN